MAMTHLSTYMYGPIYPGKPPKGMRYIRIPTSNHTTELFLETIPNDERIADALEALCEILSQPSIESRIEKIKADAIQQIKELIWQAVKNVSTHGDITKE
jgi:hypothetical protein